MDQSERRQRTPDVWGQLITRRQPVSADQGEFLEAVVEQRSLRTG